MISRFLFVLALVVSAIPASAQSLGPAPYTVFVVGAAADLSTTLVALKNPRLAEGNPLLGGGTANLVGIKVGGTAGVALAMRYMAKHGHPKWAKVIGYGFGVWWGGLAINNARLTNKYGVGR